MRLRTMQVLIFTLVFVTDGFASDLTKTAKPFLETYCVGCHGSRLQKGDRRFDTLSMVVEDMKQSDTAILWQDILDKINLGEMPPKRRPQPSEKEVRKFVALVTQELMHVQEKIKVAKAPLRRLNRFEYRNTVRDLFKMNVDSFDPTESFPADGQVEGFDNNSEALVLSAHLMQNYLSAASGVLDKAIHFDSRPEQISILFRPDDFTGTTRKIRPQVGWIVKDLDGTYVDLAHGGLKTSRLWARKFRRGVPADGFYHIRVRATGINRQNMYTAKELRVDKTEPIKLMLVGATQEAGSPGKYNNSEREIATFELVDDEVRDYEVRIWLDKGYVPVIRYPNGPQPIKRVVRLIAEKHHPESLNPDWRKYQAEASHKGAPESGPYLSDVYQGPRVRVYELAITGPESPDWPPASHQTIFGSGGEPADSVDVAGVLSRFATRAFRRPVSDQEMEPFVALVNRRRQQGEGAEDAIKAGLKAVMCSPHFLYLVEEDEQLSDYAIASRLSYFLWSSMPDDALFALAEKGELKNPKTIELQVRRMLADEKAKSFVDRFTDTWLRLNTLGSMPPDEKMFRSYYQFELEPLMKTETRLFFKHLLDNNLSIEDFLDSDYTFVNAYMAQLYGLEGIVGDDFRKVALSKDSMRGGLLGHASVLTATSNGVETSPVVRGVWILENILGTPPSPPPPDVEPLEPDIRGATTIRDQLAKHRKVSTCNDCHRKIDPLGFALENYDPIGSFRPTYKRRKEIETAGELPSGEKFEDITQLKGILKARKDQFAHCLTEKMLTYATGRVMTHYDRSAVDEIVKGLSQKGYGLKDLVVFVATSKTFLEE